MLHEESNGVESKCKSTPIEVFRYFLKAAQFLSPNINILSRFLLKYQSQSYSTHNLDSPNSELTTHFNDGQMVCDLAERISSFVDQKNTF